MYAYNPNESAVNEVYYDGSYHAAFTIPQNAGFKQYTYVFTTLAASQTIEFHLWNNTTGIYYDKVEVRKVIPDIVTTPIAGYWWAVNNSSPENGGTWVPRVTNVLTTPAL